VTSVARHSHESGLPDPYEGSRQLTPVMIPPLPINPLAYISMYQCDACLWCIIAPGD